MIKRPYKQIKILVTVTIMLVVTFLFAFPKIGLADANNIFVEDYAGILSDKDKTDIKNINEENFINLPGQPQYVVVTLKNLDGYDSAKDYAVQKFEELGIGDKDLDNGFLFVISVEDRAYSLETGYGVEDVITDGMKDDVVTSKATELLQDEQYGAAVMIISRNIESLVTEKYGDIEASKEIIEQKKAANARFKKIVFFTIWAIIFTILFFIMIYLLSIRKLRKVISKNYLNKNLMGYVFVTTNHELIGTSNGMKQVNLSQYLARTLYRLPSKQKMLTDEIAMKQWLAKYLLLDSIINYWRESSEAKKYDISVYLEDKYLSSFENKMIGKSQNFNFPVSENPYLKGKEIEAVGHYVSKTQLKHKEALKISKQNKNYIEKVCEHFLEEKRISLRKVDHQLEVALMVYYFLQEKDLSDPNLLQKITINEKTLRQAFSFAEKRRKQISNDQKKKALNDLTNMTLGSYYMQAMIWSSYRSRSNSSSIGGGGGSSFGGGSSGGGGFSGGW